MPGNIYLDSTLLFAGSKSLNITIVQEAEAKEKEEKKKHVKTTPEQDDISLFYSDIMPLLVTTFSPLIFLLLHTIMDSRETFSDHIFINYLTRLRTDRVLERMRLYGWDH